MSYQAPAKSDRESRSSKKQSPTATWTSRRDPVVGVYLDPTSTQTQREFVIRSLVYFSCMGEGKKPLDLVAADAEVGAMTMTDATIYTAQNPFKQRLSGPVSLWKFYGYIQARKNLHWAPGDPNPKFFLAVMPGNEFHPVV